MSLEYLGVQRLPTSTESTEDDMEISSIWSFQEQGTGGRTQDEHASSRYAWCNSRLNDCGSASQEQMTRRWRNSRTGRRKVRVAELIEVVDAQALVDDGVGGSGIGHRALG